jgi:hypothetical protein
MSEQHALDISSKKHKRVPATARERDRTHSASQTAARAEPGRI